MLILIDIKYIYRHAVTVPSINQSGIVIKATGELTTLIIQPMEIRMEEFNAVQKFNDILLVLKKPPV